MKNKNQKAVAVATPVAEVETSKPQTVRGLLKELSTKLKPLVTSGMYSTINEALIDKYTTDEHKEFRSFENWKSEGYFVKKGSKAFPIWGKPVKATDENDYDYFPIAHVFSNAQVELSKKEAQA